VTTSSGRDFLHIAGASIAGANSALAASGAFPAGALAAHAGMLQADMPQDGDGLPAGGQVRPRGPQVGSVLAVTSAYVLR
jgi:hypothetical protein